MTVLFQNAVQSVNAHLLLVDGAYFKPVAVDMFSQYHLRCVETNAVHHSFDYLAPITPLNSREFSCVNTEGKECIISVIELVEKTAFLFDSESIEFELDCIISVPLETHPSDINQFIADSIEASAFDIAENAIQVTHIE